MTYTVWDKQKQQEAVLKILHAAGATARNDEEERAKQKAIELFRRETDFLKRSLHPGLPAYIGDFDERNYPCLLMERIDGRNLLDEMEDRGNPFTEKELVPLMIQLCDILRVVHGEGILHRDIKPENIMRRRHYTASQPEIELIDLGGAREMDARYYAQMGGAKRSGVQTLSGISQLYTVGYAPTEQMHGRPMIASDLYAVGATMIHLLTGKKPEDVYDTETLRFQWRLQLPKPVSNDLVQIIDKLTASTPSERFSSAMDLKFYLERVGEGFTFGGAKAGGIDPAQIRISPSHLSFPSVHKGEAKRTETFTIQNEGSGTLNATVSADDPVIIQVRPTRVSRNKDTIEVLLNTGKVEWGQTYALHVNVEISRPPKIFAIPVSVEVAKHPAVVRRSLGVFVGGLHGALAGTIAYVTARGVEAGAGTPGGGGGGGWVMLGMLLCVILGCSLYATLGRVMARDQRD